MANNRLFTKWNPVKRAMLVIGAKFGGCGNNRVITASITKPKATLISVLLSNIQIILQNYKNLYYLVKYIFLLEYKS